jgi:hypothetical protein
MQEEAKKMRRLFSYSWQKSRVKIPIQPYAPNSRYNENEYDGGQGRAP